jgi:hypothetical protein
VEPGEPARGLPQPAHLVTQTVRDQVPPVQFGVVLPQPRCSGRPARRSAHVHRRDRHSQHLDRGQQHQLHPRYGQRPGSDTRLRRRDGRAVDGRCAGQFHPARWRQPTSSRRCPAVRDSGAWPRR